MRNTRTVGFHPEDLAGEYSVSGQFKNPRSALRTANDLINAWAFIKRASKDGESSEYFFERSDYSYIVIVQSNIS